MRFRLLILALVTAVLLVLPGSAARAQESPAGVQDTERDDVDLDAYEEERLREDIIDRAEFTEADMAQALLIVPFSAATRESEGVAGLLATFVQDALRNQNRFSTVSLDQCAPIDEVSAALYYEGCPRGNELGCQFVIGENAQVDRVVGGRVTVRQGGRYRVAVTILNVDDAELEFSYAVDLAPGEETLLPRTVELALDRLRREELLAPLRASEAAQAERQQAVLEAETEEELALVGRMDISLREGELQRLEEDQRNRVAPRMTEEDIQELEGAEGVPREWEDLGISARQYLSYRNSGLEFDTWRWRWAGHRLQLLGNVHFGFIGGATGLRYSGEYLMNEDLTEEVDSLAWQRVEAGSSGTIGVGIGIGILRNLDLEVSGFWSRSKVHLRLTSGATVSCSAIDPPACDDPEDTTQLVPDPTNRPTGDWAEQSVNLWGGELMLRYYILTGPVVRPTVGAGLTWLSYPTLYNDPDVADDQEQPPPPIRGRFKTFRRLVDIGPQLEPGVMIDLTRNFGIFLRVPITFSISPRRTEEYRSFRDAPILAEAEMPGTVPFGVVRVVLGVQGRLFGLAVQPNFDNQDDDLIDEIEQDDEAEDSLDSEPSSSDGTVRVRNEAAGDAGPAATKPKRIKKPNAKNRNRGDDSAKDDEPLPELEEDEQDDQDDLREFSDDEARDGSNSSEDGGFVIEDAEDEDDGDGDELDDTDSWEEDDPESGANAGE
ncbi:MAG: hypothetical protein CL928_13475 [Deltaproteobacteria bacterium]|nr:hypothetical protein [Deltaproteobacteria bacterium]